MASLYNLMNAQRVDGFLKELEDANQLPFHDRDRLLQSIHMLIWLHSCRPGTTAGAYAMMGLMDAIGLERWEFKRDPEAEKAAADAAAANAPVQIDPHAFAGLFPEPPPLPASPEVTRALYDAVDSVFLGRFSGLVKSGAQPTVGGKPASWASWVVNELAGRVERSLEKSVGSKPA